MKYVSPFCLAWLSAFLLAAHAAAPDPSLTGCWRAVRIVVHQADGTRLEDTSGRCTLHFTEDRFESRCGTRTGVATTTYRYRSSRPNVYAITMTGSTFSTSLVGSTREYEYRVDADRLVTSASSLPKVETEAVRTPCLP